METKIFYALLILQFLFPFGVLHNVFGQES